MMMYNIENNKLNNTFLANCIKEYKLFLLKYD